MFRSQRPPGALGPRSGPGLSSPLVPCRLFILNHTHPCQTSLHKAEARPCRLAPAPNSSPTSRPAWLVWDVMLQRGSRILQRGALGESEDLVALMAGLAGKELMKIRPLQHLHDLLARKLKSHDNCVHCLGQRASRPAWGQLSTPPPPPCLQETDLLHGALNGIERVDQVQQHCNMQRSHTYHGAQFISRRNIGSLGSITQQRGTSLCKPFLSSRNLRLATFLPDKAPFLGKLMLRHTKGGGRGRGK